MAAKQLVFSEEARRRLQQGIDVVADDLDTRSSVRCPTFRVARVTVAGT